MRVILEKWILESDDQGQYPEDPEVIAHWVERMREWAADRIERIYREEGILK